MALVDDGRIVVSIIELEKRSFHRQLVHNLKRPLPSDLLPQ